MTTWDCKLCVEETLELEALSHSLRAVKTSGAGWFPVQLVGELDLNLSEHVGNGYFDCQDF